MQVSGVTERPQKRLREAVICHGRYRRRKVLEGKDGHESQTKSRGQIGQELEGPL